MMRLEKCSIDLERFAFLVKSKLDDLGLSYRDASKICGASTRQISDVIHGKPVGAGSTIMLAMLCGIDVELLFSGSKLERLHRVMKVHERDGDGVKFQTVTPNVKRETCGAHG